MYLFLDGYYLGIRKGGREKEAVLIAHGLQASEVVGSQAGVQGIVPDHLVEAAEKFCLVRS